MKILVLGSEIPATANMPGSPRLFSLCRLLSRRHKLTLVTLNASKERLRSFRDDPLSAGVFEDVTVLPQVPGHSWLGQQMHRVRFEASFVTRSRTPNFFAEQRASILDICTKGRFDVVYADGLPISQYLIESSLGCPAIIDLHDCFTFLFTRTIRTEPRLKRKLALYLECKSIAKLERSLSGVFSKIIFNSSIDEAFFKKMDPGADTLTIGNGVDSGYFSSTASDPEAGKLVFTGVMDYGPNVDAAVYFSETVFPLIRERHPNVQFWIVGKDPSDRVRALASSPGIHVTGGVPDVRPYMRSASVFVCPLRYGSGVKNKLLAALSMNKAVVATRLSLEGLDLRENEDLLIADEPTEFATKVIELIEHTERAKQLGLSGQASVMRKYSWEKSAEILRATLENMAAP